MTQTVLSILQLIMLSNSTVRHQTLFAIRINATQHFIVVCYCPSLDGIELCLVYELSRSCFCSHSTVSAFVTVGRLLSGKMSSKSISSISFGCSFVFEVLKTKAIRHIPTQLNDLFFLKKNQDFLSSQLK